MPTQARRMRLLGAPYRQQLFDAHLDSIAEIPAARGTAGSGSSEIVFMLRSLRLLTPPALHVVDGQVCEVAHGERTAARLRFPDASWLWRSGAFERFDELAPHHGARRLFGVSHYRDPARGTFFWVETGTDEPGQLAITSRSCLLESAEGEASTPEPVDVVRRWASTPPSVPSLMSHRPVIHTRFGGDPVTIHLGKRVLHTRLFIGGLHHQRERRPAVDHVLNLCGLDNPWCERFGPHSDDRFSHKGEGPFCMTAEELLLEGAWVAERLRAGKRVLVHCYAGMNRSSTVCCAALMLLEGISAEAALARVRQRHPIAWPDPYHWFILQHLSHARARARPSAWLADEAETACRLEDGMERAPLLREVSTVG